MKPLSSDSRTAHGLNASAVICDELHVWTKPDARELYEALVTSQGARRQPINIAITTAGTAEPTLWLDIHNYAEQVRDGIIVDPSFLPAIWAAKKDEPWDDKEVWYKVNPSLGDTVQEEFYEQECAKAKALPSYANAFRRLYLNQPTEQMDRFLSMDDYDHCEPRYTLEELKGRRCYAGLDLSSTLDLTALVLVFPREQEEGSGYDVLPYFFVPEDNLLKRQRDDNVPYVTWKDGGFIIPTPGDIVDYVYIRNHINELREQSYDIKEVVLDRWNATQVAVWLEEDGFEVGFFGQGYRSMSAPTKELEAMVMSKKLRHDNNPVLRWNASVCAAEQDAAGNLKLSKKRSSERIDGMVATVMGIGRATASITESESVYEDRDMEIL
jgi:phage terminase large subunit-like protein